MMKPVLFRAALVALALLSTACLTSTAPPTTCSDGVLNGRETEVDCGGGLCAGCPTEGLCVAHEDCDSGVCALGQCAAPTCFDWAQNGDETDVDCGGSCGACAAQAACATTADCAEGACDGGVCVSASCTDGVANGDETDIDCGGSCAPCADLSACVRNTDCTSGSCANGECGGSVCPSGLLTCTSGCVDALVDPDNCGGCGVTCVGAEICSAGSCVEPCVGGTLSCGGGCVDVGSDPQNCGDCGIACAPGQYCEAGVCAFSCGPSQVDCGGVCATLDSDSQNCGACGNVCPAGFSCLGGGCVEGCQSPMTSCATGPEACVDTFNDPANCGACEAACPPPDNAVSACFNGTCGIGYCTGNFTDCNGDTVDGCETDITTDTDCGQCNRACSGAETCTFGSCCQPPPSGSYQSTCINCTLCDDFLACDCEDPFFPGDFFPTGTEYDPLCSDYINCQGVLQCGDDVC